MKYSDILILTKDELMSVLIAKNVPVTGTEAIQQLRAMVKALQPSSTMELDNVTEKSDEDADNAAESVPGGDDRNPDEMEEMAEILNQMTLYKARKELAELKVQVAALESGTVDRKLTIDIKDIESTLQNFSGDDHVGVHAWIREMDLAAATHGLSDSQRWLLGNRKLQGSARSYTMYEKTTTWKELSECLLKVFGFQMTNHEVAKQLQSRSILKGESLLQYFIAMRNIAGQGTFEDMDVIKYIVDGLQDHTGCAAPLYYCVSLDELREKMMRYQIVQAEFKRKPQVSRTAVPLRQSSSANISDARNADANIRCFNCRSMGHFSNQCKKPRRPEGGCFHCFETGHQFRECPKRIRTAALCTSDEKEEEDDSVGGTSFIQLIPEAP
ncbi:uncharacterized protein [Drosophila takahashii]|uniref:uncharacterized protein n=1 Tax=Drosophila takahashii TaxID=29030 RepID=UPI0007E6934D